MNDYFNDWSKVINKQDILNVTSKLNLEYNKYNVFPEKNNVFSVFKQCNLSDLKVFMLGQFPYTNFDCSNNELLNILKEASIDYKSYHNIVIFDDSLKEWNKQGVFICNVALTCKNNNPISHLYLWRNFIKNLLINISKSNPGIIYVLFGNIAKTFRKYLPENSYILEEESLIDYYNNNKRMKHSVFKEINKIVTNLYKEPIKWFNY